MTSSNEITKMINDWAAIETQKMQLDLFEGIRNDTPVRSGRAQNGWHNKTQVTEMGQTGEIENLVPYIGWLEFGTEKMQPFAMVRTNLARVTRK